MRIEIEAALALLLAAALREFPEPSPEPAAEPAERGHLRITIGIQTPESTPKGQQSPTSTPTRPHTLTPSHPTLQPGSHGLSYRLENHRLWLGTTAGARAAVDLKTHRADLTVPAEAPEPARDVAGLLGIALPYLYREFGLFPVHCAAVLSGTRPLLLAGVSGSGKSTTAALLAASGLTWLADDLILLEPLAHTLRLHGIPRPPRLDPTAQQHLHSHTPTLPHAHTPTSPHSHTPTLPHPHTPTLPHATTITATRPALLLFPRVTPGPDCTLEPLTRPQALNELVRCSLLMGERTPTGDHLHALATLALHSRPARLHLGPDTRALPEMLLSLLPPLE